MAAARHAPNCPRNGPGGSLVRGSEQCHKIARQIVLLGKRPTVTDNSSGNAGNEALQRLAASSC
jgi:hypothetical protein